MKKLTLILLLFISGTIFSQETKFISPGFEIAENTNGEWNLVLEDNDLITTITISKSKLYLKNKNEEIIIFNLTPTKDEEDKTTMQFSGNLNSNTGKEVLVLFANNAIHLINKNKINTYKNIQ